MPGKDGIQQDLSITVALLEQGRSVRVTPSGNSMRPLLDGVSDSVVLEKAPDELRAGDMVLYKNAQGVLVLHRVWSVEGDSYTMLGDGNVRLERGISKKNVYGVAKEVTRGSKTRPTSSLQLRAYASLWKTLYPFRLLRQKVRAIMSYKG